MRLSRKHLFFVASAGRVPRSYRSSPSATWLRSALIAFSGTAFAAATAIASVAAPASATSLVSATSAASGTSATSASSAASWTSGLSFPTIAAPDPELTATLTGTGTGTVISDPAGISCPTTCAADFISGTAVTLTGTANSGSTFAGWSGAGCSGTSPCMLTMTASDEDVTATFNVSITPPIPPPATNTLTVTRAGTGSGTVTSAPAGINCGSTCSASFNTGTSVTLTAAPASGSTFGGWSGAGCSGTGTCMVTMSAAQSVTATFNGTASAPPFPSSNVSYPNGAIISFGGTHYVFAGGRAFGIATPALLAKIQAVDKAKILSAPAGATAPSSTTPRSGVLVFTKPVNGNATIYVVGTDGELHGFATPKQFGTDGYNGKYVVTVPTLGSLKVGSNAGTTITALVTKADAAIVNSSGTFYTFAGGRAFGIPTPAELTRIRAANTATVLSGSVTTGGTVASGVLLSVTPTVYVTYNGYAYPFPTMTKLMNTGYGGTAGIPVPHTGGLPVVSP